MHPQGWETQLQEASALLLVQVPGLLTGKRSSSMTKRFVRFWSLCKFPKLVVIVLSLCLLLSFKKKRLIAVKTRTGQCFRDDRGSRR